VAAEDNSLATAQASVTGTVEEDADQALASTAAQGAKTLVSVDVDTNDVASRRIQSTFSPAPPAHPP